jgi:hypothetical protein
MLSSGCLVPYAYPHLCVVPGVQASPKHEDVRAFRVDVTGNIVDVGVDDSFRLTAVPISSSGRTPALIGLSLDYGFYVIGGALNYPVHHGHSTLLRLYCRGYQLLQIRGWEVPGRISLDPATDLSAQEKAVDDLLSPPAIEAPRLEFQYGLENPIPPEGWEVKNLKPGSASAEHRSVLLFAASEYERLAMLVNPDETDRQPLKARFLYKAETLRKRAAE